MVILENGIIGYIYQTYVTEIPPVQIEKIDISIDTNILKKGETKQLQIKISPEEASNHKVQYISNNPKIATVDDKGNIHAIRSGKTTIKVKAEENDVQSEIEIEVYTSVTGIKLDQEEIYMEVGDTFKISGSVKPDDANDKLILYQSTNASIATIQEYGIITATKEGKTKIIATSNENSNIKTECEVNVVRPMDDSEIHFDSSLIVNGLEMTGIDYKENTVQDIRNKIITDYEIEIVNNRNEVLKDTDIVGTGTKIRVKEDGEILREYQIIIYGDSNGDGKINSVDLLVIQRHILEIERLSGVYKKASNINKNGKEPNSVDLLLIQRHILELQFIKQ